MRFGPAVLALGILLVASPPRAEEATVILSHQGRLLDGADAPVSGTLALTFSIYDVAADPPEGAHVEPLWTESYNVTLFQGVYAVSLGSQADSHEALPASVFSNSARWLGITVGTAPELAPRLRIGTAPFAIHADDAALAAEATHAAQATHAGDADHAELAAALDCAGCQSGTAGASATPAANKLLPLDANGKFPISVLPGGTAGGLDADTVDGFDAHAASAPAANALVALDANAKLPLSVLPGGSASGLNADQVDGFDAKPASGPQPNALVALDGAAKLPFPVFPVGATSTTLAAGDHAHPNPEVTSIMIGTVTLSEDVLRGLLKPTLLSPSDGAGVGPAPTLTWAGVPPFTAEVATAANPTTAVWTLNTSATSATVNPTLNGAILNYVWRVHSKAGGGDYVSADRAFKTLTAVTLGSGIVDPVRTPFTNASAGATAVTVTSATGFSAGDKLLVIDLQGTNAGVYDVASITSISGPTLTLDHALTGNYPSGDKNVAQKMIYGGGVTVTAGANVTATTWDGTSGGVVAIYSEGDIVVQGGAQINVDASGYRNGAWRNSCSGVNVSVSAQAGESLRGPGPFQSTANNGGGGGAVDGCATCTSAGGGGGYGAAGSASGSNTPGTCAPGQGGTVYGDTSRTSAFLGSGGGGTNRTEGGPGGRGGGVIMLFATGAVQNSGTLTSKGGAGSGLTYSSGGGGSGGTILIVAPTVSAGAAAVDGGPSPSVGGLAGGAGGAGRLKTFLHAP